MSSGIYGIHNLINDKWYVGQAVNIRARWNAHKSMLLRNERESIHLLRAWKKYGADAFEWVILEECDPDQLDEREIYWIKEKNSYTNGYNRTLGGGGIHGYHLTQEHKARIGKRSAELWADKEQREKRIKAIREATSTKEYKEKQIIAKQKMWSDPVFREESLKRMQEGANDPEAKKRRINAVKKALSSPETKKKISSASIRNWKDTAYREKMEKAREIFMNEEYKERASIQSKERWKSKECSDYIRKRISEGRREHGQEVIQVETGRLFSCIADAAETLNISCSHIGSACLGKRRMAGNYHWRYSKDTPKDWIERRMHYLIGAGIIAYPQVVCIETGEIFEQPSLAAKKLGVHPSNITKVCRGEQLSAGGYRWKYLNETVQQREKREELVKKHDSYIPNKHSFIQVICVETGVIYDSVSMAAKALNIKRSSISNVLTGRSKTAGGYHWKYADEKNFNKGRTCVLCVETGVIYDSIISAAEEYHVSHGAISNVLRGKNETSAGVHWKYAESGIEDNHFSTEDSDKE